MYIQPSLLALLLLSFFSAPLLVEWVLAPGSAWYKPFILWFVFIVVYYLTIFRGRHDEF